MVDLVLVRHGESTWNKENRFTGWEDVPLSERGVEEALEAGRVLAGQDLAFELVYTSVLKRAIKTLWLMLEQMDRMWLPVERSWRLNERHYGALQGLNKAETAAKYGEQQVLLWRRSYDVPPPALERDDPRFPGHDPRYAGVDPAELPLAESLKDTVARFLPYWEGTIAPQLAAGRGVLICAHGNSLRALIKHLDDMTEDEIVGLNLPTGIPKVYRLGADLKPLESFYCGDPEALQAAIDKVKSQGRAAG